MLATVFHISLAEILHFEPISEIWDTTKYVSGIAWEKNRSVKM